MELSKKLEAQIAQWNEELKDKSPMGVIGYFLQHYGDKIVLSTSLGLEDQVITEMVLRQRKKTEVFTLDTGRLFPETYDLIARTNKFFGIISGSSRSDATWGKIVVSDLGSDVNSLSLRRGRLSLGCRPCWAGAT